MFFDKLTKLLWSNFEENKRRGDELFLQGNFGEAKLAFERAVSKAKPENKAEADEVKGKIRACRIELANAKMSRGDMLVEAGDFEEALTVFSEAKDICDDPDVTAVLEKRVKALKSKLTRMFEEDAEEISDDKLLAVIAGTWSEPQAEEYASMPDTFKEAVLAIHDGDYKKAVDILNDISSSSDLPTRPRYIFFELAQARFMAGDAEGAVASLGKFFDSMEEHEDIETLVTALNLKAGALNSLERYGEAEEVLIQATEAAPKDHRMFFNLGVFLKNRGKGNEALTALEKAQVLMGQMRPDFAVIRELGLTYLSMNKINEAKKYLNSIVQQTAALGDFQQLDPMAAIPLAKIHEEEKDFVLAAGLYRHLASGYDIKNHFIYNLESGRLLKLAGENQDLIEQYLSRADELASNDSERELVEKAHSLLE